MVHSNKEENKKYISFILEWPELNPPVAKIGIALFQWKGESCVKSWKPVQWVPTGRTALVWLRSSAADFVQTHWVLYLMVETGKRVRNELSKTFLKCLSICFPLLSLHRHLRRLEMETQGGFGSWLSHCCKLALRELILMQSIGLAMLEKFPNVFVNLIHPCQLVSPKCVMT